MERSNEAVEPFGDTSTSPYLWVPEGDSTERLPLESSRARVRISGVIAQVRIDQIFKNDGEVPIEVEYVFPGSTRAAVHGMRMVIDDRIVEAKIEETKRAKATYAAAKAEGKVASILVQERRNVFTMRVANIMPGARIRVELEYSERLMSEEGVFEFVYPAVVGPRYGGAAGPNDGWVATPYVGEGKSAPRRFSLEVEIESGIALKDLRSPSHELLARFDSETEALVKMNEENGGDRDFVLRFEHARKGIESGVLVHDDDGTKYFFVMLEPPPRVEPEQVVPREYVFVMDVSGSMNGFPLDTSRVLMTELLEGLGSDERFNLILFAGSSYQLSDTSLRATEENIAAAEKVVMHAPAGGGTELMPALERAYALPKTEGMSRTIVVVTDGYVTVEDAAFKLIRESLNEAGVFAFGVGTGVNRELIEGMARAGMGEPFVVMGEEEARAQVSRFRRYVEAPVLTDVSVSFDGIQVEDVFPRPESIPDLRAQRPVALVGKYTGDAVGTATLKGTGGDGPFERTVSFEGASRERSSPLRMLWARSWVGFWEDALKLDPDDESLQRTVVDLGTEHCILTSRTSFVAVDSEVVNERGRLDKVRQPLPLPKGVSNNALGGPGDMDGDRIPDAVDSCPAEPETYNGTADSDGCPDQGRVMLIGDEIKIMRRVHFDEGSAIVKEEDWDFLDSVAATIINNPQLDMVHISGHIDAVEMSAKEKTLARERAESVLRYLVSKGVARDKLTVGGYDDKCPLDGADTDDARERNRRVDFHVVSIDENPTGARFACTAAIDAGLVADDMKVFLP